ncbi:hypothetical protein M23134_06988, partial [Microscilla marina ATCC 23134]
HIFPHYLTVAVYSGEYLPGIFTHLIVVQNNTKVLVAIY